MNHNNTSRRQRSTFFARIYYFFLLIPAFFTVFLFFQGAENGFRIRLTPAGRLECTQYDGCLLPNAKSLNFLVVGDIGGLPVYPYYSYAQTKVARAMVHAARKQPLHFVMNVGDNFYFNGVKNIFDPRFEDSFENVYDFPELLVPWYTIAGNHDHMGNISAQITHTNFSNKWTFPNLFYKVRISFDFSVPEANLTEKTGNEEVTISNGDDETPKDQEQQIPPVVLEIFFLDTIVLCGNTVDVQGDSIFSWLFAKKLQPNGPPPKYQELAHEQWEWIERELANSSADYLFVVGHYPIYSTCEHGNFGCLQRLDTLLHRHRVNVYWSGHDHNMQHIHMTRNLDEAGNAEENDNMGNYTSSEVDYIVCGASSRSDRSAKHLDDVPKEALLFRYPTGWNPISQIGFSDGAFVQAQLERNGGKLNFYSGNQKLIYNFEVKPRRRPTSTVEK